MSEEFSDFCDAIIRRGRMEDRGGGCSRAKCTRFADCADCGISSGCEIYAEYLRLDANVGRMQDALRAVAADFT